MHHGLIDRCRDIEGGQTPTTCPILCERYTILHWINHLFLEEKFIVEPIAAYRQIIQISVLYKHLTVGLNMIV